MTTVSRGPICLTFLGIRGLKFGLPAVLVLYLFVCGTLHADNGEGPDIYMWRGVTQSFGDLGNPQRCVNLLGTVSDPDGLASLSYSLNGGSSRSLSIGPDTRRLARPGDFNVELDVIYLITGENSVVITAQDQLGVTSTQTVTLHYNNNPAWPLPYSIDWGAVTNLQDVVQEVDGPWAFTSTGARPLHMDYDRVLAIGDICWTDYEFTVPITVHSTDPSSFFNPISTGPGIGLIVRWRGHSDWGSQLGGPWQPVIGWLPQGANWWYEYFSNGTGRLSLRGENGLQLLDPTYKQLRLETTYMTRTRVESTSSGGGGGIYRFRIWESGTPEPTSWLLEGQEGADDISSGSLLLVAHHVDATFGNITVVPPSLFSYGVKSMVSGRGTITLSPDLPVYPKGTFVTATAEPVIGHTFTVWSGDLSGSESTTSFVVDGDKTITASFSSASSGITSGSDEFNSPVLDTGTWTFVDPLGDATLAMTGSQLSISLPTGTDHDTWWPGGYNVARVMQSIANEDFQIEAKFDSVVASKYQMQGIVIQEDEDSLLRIELHHDGSAVKLYVASFNNTVSNVLITKSIAVFTRYMRVTRTGDSWVIVHSSDGSGWTTEQPFSLNLAAQVAGLYAGNHTVAHTALIDYFHISTSPLPNQAPFFTTRPINSGGATQDELYAGTLAGTASDVDTSDSLTYSMIGSGWLQVAPDGSLSGTPRYNDVGSQAFTVRVTDTSGEFDEAVLYITVANVNDAPEFSAETVFGVAGTVSVGYSNSLAANDPDIGDPLTYVLESAPTWLVVAADGSLSGTPEASHVGLNNFTVRVTDAAGLYDLATLQITVVTAPASGLSVWLTENSLPADPTIDTDGDSMSNIFEYIVGGDPVNRNDMNLMPKVELVLEDPDGDSTASEYFLFTYPRRDSAANDPTVNIKVEWSTDLAILWSIADDGINGVTILTEDNAIAEGVDLVRVYIPRFLEVNGKIFARLSGSFTDQE